LVFSYEEILREGALKGILAQIKCCGDDKIIAVIFFKNNWLDISQFIIQMRIINFS